MGAYFRNYKGEEREKQIKEMIRKEKERKKIEEKEAFRKRTEAPIKNGLYKTSQQRIQPEDEER